MRYGSLVQSRELAVVVLAPGLRVRLMLEVGLQPLALVLAVLPMPTEW
jgi:hypothetical protein